MSSTGIRNRIKSGLAKAIGKVGSGTSQLIYRVTYTNTGGVTPLNPPVNSEVLTKFTNAIFKSYTSGEFGSNTRAGDKTLVSDSDVVITEGDLIKQGTTYFDVVSVDTKAPTSDALVYISQVRQK